MACNNPKPADNDTSSGENSGTPETSTTNQVSNQSDVLSDWEKMGSEVERISGRIADELESWDKSVEDMEYPESATAQLSDIDKKKLELVIGSSKQVTDKFEAISTEFNAWKTIWDRDQTDFQELKAKLENETAKDKYQAEFEVLQNTTRDYSRKLKDWENRLNAVKAESVLILNSVNGIIFG